MIVEETISEELFALLKSAPKGENPEVAMKSFCDNIAKVIADAVRTGTVNLSTGEIT